MAGNIQPGRQPSDEELSEIQREDEFFTKWNRESVKSSIALSNDMLKQLVTLNTALLGGTVAFLDEDMLDPWAKLFTVFAFFIALIISWLGMLPHETRVSRDPDQIRRDKANALQHKRNFLWFASSSMALGFGVALVGFVVKHFMSS